MFKIMKGSFILCCIWILNFFVFTPGKNYDKTKNKKQCAMICSHEEQQHDSTS